MKEKGVADVAQAGVAVSGLELGGLVGSLIAGRLSDYLINKSNGKGGAVGKRVQVGARECWGQQTQAAHAAGGGTTTSKDKPSQPCGNVQASASWC